MPLEAPVTNAVFCLFDAEVAIGFLLDLVRDICPRSLGSCQELMGLT